MGVAMVSAASISQLRQILNKEGMTLTFEEASCLASFLIEFATNMKISNEDTNEKYTTQSTSI